MPQIQRNPTRPVRIGSITIGQGHPIAVQSMTATPTSDIDATVALVRLLESAGADVVRIAVDSRRDAAALAEIRAQTSANLAVDHRRREARQPLAAAEVEALLDVPDDAPDATAVAAGRDELVLLQRALDELPARRRAIFLAARLGAQTHREIADRHGISTRAVEINVQRALEHCARRLEKNPVRRFGPRPVASS